MKINKIQLFFTSLILFLPAQVFAESNLQLSVMGEIRPINTITLNLSSIYKDIGGTKVFWFEDNVLVEEGVGLISHRVSLGPIGSSITVAAVLGIPGSLGAERATIILSPAYIDLIWEAQTAVPPFYRGKALPSHESFIKTMAIPNFGTTTPGSVINYSWKKNRTISIGDGLNIISAGLFGAWEKTSTNIQVNATYKDQTAVSQVNIPSFVPTLQFYEISPTQGILTNESLNGSPIRNSSEISLTVVPFGFSSIDRNKSKIQYKWKAGKKEIKKGVGYDSETLSLSRNNSNLKNGEILISLLAENVVNVMQFDNSKFSWKFTQN
jgi:hypothetical protein